MVGAREVPGFSENDRLGLAFFTSILAHMVLILGVTFAAPHIKFDHLATLEITLVQTHTEKTPDNPQFLAQANQDGGGDTDKAVVAKSPVPLQEASERTTPLPGARPRPRPPADPAAERAAMLSDEAKRKLAAPQPRPERKPEQSQPQAPGLAEELARERARLTAEISQTWQEYQKRPKRQFINARTQQYKYTVYMESWRAKVERVGNLNYPEEARRRRLSGQLLLDVAINPDGSVNKVTLRRGSGQKLLDDAAIRIIELAAPFDPFPPDIRAETDILHITRTWRFNEALLTSNE
jgi:protein TonB